jgi:AcrR family transcriptional regulator
MARTVNVESHAVRRDAFVDAAQRLIQTRGYEQTSIGDILAETDASRGAFYHYFDSKAAVLEAVIDRMVDAAIATVIPIAEDPALTATQKLVDVFAGIGRFKGERTELLLAIMRVWLADANAIVRDKFRHGARARLVPLLTTIIEQGVDESEFTATSPSHTAGALVSLLLGTNEVATELWFARQANTVTLATVEDTFAAYAEAFERILGARPGSLAFADTATIRQWYG